MLTWLFVFSVLLELGLHLIPLFWRYRRLISVFLIIIVSFTNGIIITRNFNLVGGLCLIIGAFRVINLLRIIEGRTHIAYLSRATRRSSIIFIILQTGCLAIVYLLITSPQNIEHELFIAGIIQLLTAASIFSFTSYNIYKTKHKPVLKRYADNDLPTVSIAIPARNETEDLEECLKTIIANDYPKLEILVLDDCSQDKTPEIIRSFAQDGVRFFPGSEPGKRWLAKNQAYEKLAQEANGEYIIFCGVDVRFGPSAIRALVTTAMVNKKQMVSVLPLRKTGSIINAFIQPPRYWWELALPRYLVDRPPVLSTCWLVSRQQLLQMGSFGSVCHAIIPEAVFARKLIKTKQYSFIRADDELDIQTRKKPVDQRDTVLRTLYPQIRRRPEMALMLTVIDLALLLAPFFLTVLGFYIPLGMAWWLAGAAALLLTMTHVLIVKISDPINTIVALFNLPLALLIELWYGLSSMWNYEFSIVEWKGRNICIPVMHINARPSLKDQHKPKAKLPT